MLFYDLNEIFYTSVFRMKIYGRDENPRRRKILYIEFKEYKKGLKPHLMSKLEKSFLIDFFENFDETNKEIELRGKIVKNNQIRNKKVEYKFEEFKLPIEKFIQFLKSDHFKNYTENNDILIEFVKNEYKKEWKTVEKPKILVPIKKLIKKKIEKPKPEPPKPVPVKTEVFYENKIKTLEKQIEIRDNKIEKLNLKVEKMSVSLESVNDTRRKIAEVQGENRSLRKNVDRLIQLVNKKENMIRSKDKQIEETKRQLKELEDSIEEIEVEEC